MVEKKIRIWISKIALVGCCKLSLYANESWDEHAIYFRRWLKRRAMSGLFYGAQLVTPNFYHQVSFLRRKFFLAPLFFIGTTFFRHDFSFWHDFFFGTFFSARLFWGHEWFLGHDLLFSAPFFSARSWKKSCRKKQSCQRKLCLVPRPHYSARSKRFGSRGPIENVTVRLGYVTEMNWPRGTEKTPYRD